MKPTRLEDSDTPETAAAIKANLDWSLSDPWDTEKPLPERPWEFAARMERERDMARAEFLALQHTLITTIGGTDHEGNPTSAINYMQRLRILLLDEKRMDFVDSDCFDLTWDDDRPGVTRASDGANFFGDTRRQAIDKAITQVWP